MFNTPQDIHRYLTEKLEGKIDKEILPAYEESGTVDIYMEELSKIGALKPYIITQKEFIGLVPEPDDQAKTDAWNGREQQLGEFLERIKSPDILLIQGLDSSVHEKLMLENTANEIYKKTPDISLAQVLAGIIDRYLPLEEGIEQQENRARNLAVIIEQIPLLNSDTTLFKEALIAAFDEGRIQGIGRDKFLEIAQGIAGEFAEIGIQGVYELDQKLLDVFDKELKDILDSKVDLHVKHGRNPNDITKENRGMAILTVGDVPNESPGVLITTSNGGACHKTIANQTITQLIKSGVDCVLINESELNKSDPLKNMVGISSSDLYPVVFQQCGQKQCRVFLKDIEKGLGSFIPSPEFSQLRTAVKICENNYENKEKKFNVAFSTQHYGTDLRAIPKNTEMVFQVCDYQQLAKLSNLAILAGNIPPDQQNHLIKFFIPSETCLGRREPRKGDENLFVETIYPNLVLSEKDAETKYDEFFTSIPSDEQELETPRGEGLHDPQDQEVNRCVIMMGGQGCGPLIKEYLNKFLEENIENNEDKMELIVACGNNKDVKKELLEYMQQFKLPENIKVKVCGPIPNDQLIAYNKNAVLITKPGGGSISECIQNEIQALIHYDESHWWEAGNALEIEAQGLGKVIVGDLRKAEENLNTEARGERVPPSGEKSEGKFSEGFSLTKEIKERTQQRKQRTELNEENTLNFREGIPDLKGKISSLLEEESEKSIKDNKFIAYLSDLNGILGKISENIEEKSPRDKDVSAQLHSLKHHVGNPNSEREISGKAREKLSELDGFLSKFKNTKPIAEEIIAERAKRKMI